MGDLQALDGCDFPLKASSPTTYPIASEFKRGGLDMNFEFSEDQKLLADQVRKFLDDNCTPAHVREVLEGKRVYHEDVWNGIKQLGILGTAIPEQYGGAGAGYLELCVVAEELGRAVAPVPFGSSIYLAAEAILQAGSEGQKQTYLPQLASGEKIGTLAIQERVGEVTPKSVGTSVSGDKLSGTKMPVLNGGIADLAIVAAKTGSGDDHRSISLFLVDLTQSGVTREAVATIDPTQNTAQVTFDGAAAEPLGAPGEGWEILQRVYDKAAVLFAFEQIGGAQNALEAATQYAKDRYAFGRPIGSFQGIKHMLANMYVDLELARANCYYGAWALDTDAAELPEAAATARVSATTAYQHCARNNIQVHGGMGFTWEFDCHLHYRRSNLLALVIGAKSEWENELVDRLEARNAA